MSAMRVYSNRGSEAPENTAAAFKAAFAAGADAAGCDIRRTSDGQFVAFRDASAGRLCGRDWRIAATEWAHLKPLRVAGREPIAHLDDLLNLLILRPAKEFFFRPALSKESDAADLALQVARAGVQGRVFLTACSCRAEFLAAARAAVPGIGLALTTFRPYGLPGLAEAAGVSRVCCGWGDAAAARGLFYLGASVFDLKTQAAKAAAAGVEVSAGTADHPRDLRRLAELGVQAVWTNDAAMAVKYL